ncbi:helix-turn-helix transcriptional regulator [Oceanomicrobium pacificus]|uniref:HTH luxR-type domain-containing protein n=1 Tax=Oceanomicrobium pacificus TaxID=2692916 RepID=A0A6B0TS16_9RHOB|nr:LuxR C-terminal-related transcriptional regulator [Oceanomicrobium pacificus]MXU66776.1 hypothetical protein [Oceanomicrobium pacificus]
MSDLQSVVSSRLDGLAPGGYAVIRDAGTGQQARLLLKGGAAALPDTLDDICRLVDPLVADRDRATVHCVRWPGADGDAAEAGRIAAGFGWADGTLILSPRGEATDVCILFGRIDLSDADAMTVGAMVSALAGGPLDDAAPELSPKEISYLQKAAEGLNDTEIAEALDLSLRAVRERKKKAIQDSRFSTIFHTIAHARRAGLI